MNTYYTTEKLAQQKLESAERLARTYRPDQTTPKPRHTFHLPRVAWHRQAVRHA